MASPPLEDEFADIVAKARFGLGRSLSEVARATGISVQALNDLENYRRSPTRAESDALAEALGLDPERLWAIAQDQYRPAPDRQEGSETVRVVPIQNYVGGYPVYAYLLICRSSGAAALVDTAAYPEGIARVLRAMPKVRVERLLLTHGHGDHVEGAAELVQRFGLTVVCGRGLESLPSGVGEPRRLGEGERFSVGEVIVQVLETPGHTDHCVTYCADGVAFIGDVLFAGSLGKPNYSYAASLESARKVLSLAPTTRLYAGHGPSTTVAEERAHNPFFPDLR